MFICKNLPPFPLRLYLDFYLPHSALSQICKTHFTQQEHGMSGERPFPFQLWMLQVLKGRRPSPTKAEPH